MEDRNIKQNNVFADIRTTKGFTSICLKNDAITKDE